ncbi:MAG: hypothetical protein IJ071_04210 [Ruminococcus sp.]|nr:hypothetical protein [Ruminococcus sp.]
MKDTKKVSIRTAFKKIYGEALAPLGFVFAKTKELCFIRVVNGELIHILGIQVKSRYHKLLPFGGIATLYRRDLCLDKTYRDISSWLPLASQFWGGPGTGSDEVPEGHFDYDPYSPGSVSGALQAALAEVQRLILPELDPVRSLESYIPYYMKRFHVSYMDMPSLPLKDYGSGDYTDDFAICYLLKDPLAYAEQITASSKASMQEKIAAYAESQVPDDLIYLKEWLDGKYKALLASAHAFAEDPQVRRQALDELERRKRANLEKLRSYGAIS